MQRIWLLLGFFLSLLLIRTYFFLQSQPHYLDKEPVILQGTLLQEPLQLGNRQLFRLQSVQISTQTYPEYHYGDTLRVEGNIAIAKDGSYRVYYPHITKTIASFQLLSWLHNYKASVRSSMRSVLPETASRLLSGIVFGTKEGFSDDLVQAFKTTGTTHVIAASGMNVTLFTVFLLSLLSRLFPRKLAALLAIMMVVLYAFLAEVSPSIVRASIMGVLVLLASILGRQTKAIYFLFVAVYLMIFLNPLLIFDTGFQLSVASTLGLVLSNQVVTTSEGSGIKKSREFSLENTPIIGQDLLTTLIAQISTLPILFFTFGSVSLVSVLVNVLVLWTVPILMVLGFLFAIVFFIPLVSHIILLACLPLLLYFQMIITLFNQPQFLLHLENIPLSFVFGYYCFLLAIFFARQGRKVRVENQA